MLRRRLSVLDSLMVYIEDEDIFRFNPTNADRLFVLGTLERKVYVGPSYTFTIANASLVREIIVQLL